MPTSPTMATRIALGTVALLSLAGVAGGQVSDVDDIIVYGINNDPPVELVRYVFGSDLLTTVGVVRDQFGAIPPEMEAFTYIPDGPHKGYYASSNYDAWTRSRLIKVNDFDASAYRYSNDVGFGFIVGMTAYQDADDGGKWKIYATHRGKIRAPADPSTPGFGSGLDLTNLISIDPATGIGTRLHPIIEAPATAYQGLALGPDMNDPSKMLLYGVTNIPKSMLRTIDPATGAEGIVGQMSASNLKLEALEWAFGDHPPGTITLPGIDPSWTTYGVLFAFSDKTDTFKVVNPATGEWAPYACAFDVTDAEGLAFFTWRTDPRYGIDNGFD